ncbi:MAG: hypothetical protein JWN41_1396 [Thermoleophilia bacterium]|nr:hypothetical protein [Thermoleophilia bacterium]
MSRQQTTRDETLTRHEDEFAIGVHDAVYDSVNVAKRVDTVAFDEVVPREVEHADTEHVAARDGDSGQVETLADGSISIPVFEERIVVQKELVVRERIIVRKHTVAEQYRVEGNRRIEHVEIDDSSLVD